MQCCAVSPKTIVEYEYIYEKPDLPAFPAFPDPYSVTYDDATDMVFMPLWYWQKIAEYKIDIDAIESYINQIQDIKRETEQHD